MAPKMSREELEAEILAYGKKARTLKGHLTRRIDTANAAVEMAEDARPSETLLESLRALLEKLRDQLDKAVRMIRYVQDLDGQAGGANFDHYEDSMAEEQKRAAVAENGLLRAIAYQEDALRPRQPAAAQAGPGNERYKPNEALKPALILRAHSPVELRIWVQKFEAFFVASRLHLAPIQEQHAYFRACVDEPLLARFNSRIGANTMVLEDPALPAAESCMQFLKEEFKDQHPLVSRRHDFFKEMQKPGEQFSDWAIRLKRLGDEAELVACTEDDLYVMRYLTGGLDERLRRRLLRVENPSKVLLDKEIQRYEAETKSLKATAPPAAASAAAVEKGRTQGGGPGPGARRTDGQVLYSDRLAAFRKEGRCPRCGDRKEKDTKHDCRARGKNCSACGRDGHLAAVCFKEMDKKAAGGAKAKSNEVKRGPVEGSDTEDEGYAPTSVNALNLAAQQF